MRVLHIFDHSLPLQSGYVSRSASIIRAQRARGWDTIHLTTPRQGKTEALQETFDGITFHRTPPVASKWPVLRELLEMRATERRLAEIIQTEKPDILHAHSPVLNGLPAIAAGKRFGLPVVYEMRGLWEDAAVDLGHTRQGSPRYRISRALETRAMKRADHVIAICDPLKRDVAGRGIPEEKITVVPNAADNAWLRPVAVPDPALRESLGIGSEPVLGFIGSFYAYEGLDLLLDAVRLLQQQIPAFKLLLVGGGPEDQRLRERARALQLDPIVRFTGRVPHQEVARYYALLDVLVFPRKKMRLTDMVTPLKPLEAMANKKTILASDVGGHRELIQDFKTGRLFAADDVGALASRLVEMLSNRDAAQSLAEAGRHFVEIERTWEVVAARYAGVYERLLRANT